MSVFLFIPNVIGYIRIVLLFQACYFMKTNCELTLLTYIISCLLDAVDGCAARALNQSTKFGAMLDMIVDRCSTMCLLACLIYFYPSYILLFQFSMIVDIASHWLHLHSSVLSGKSSHKFIDLKANRFLKLYYTNRIILFLMLFGFGLWSIVIGLTAPIAFLKMLISLIQLHAACVNMASVDELERSQNKAD
ncbi:CDP-diacylglycerol--inositol 3-phosphatidyltransferase [Schistosoma mansoni]|uniref:CDP-diacylglycerol--inositol 3-phosphatidyltransferase n=1 Tax=Schistosoma mansoni TaxID=6183 RepID=UPI00022C830C|nr:CDP-diacylglycerol--inositol 3-phosphatidyltransferase [Schistosoma mansoni]|eukprot:XP_018644896.1 CDP-diacylglycerol--inositol 3-phosphatidyltransferase [Schistosoma mansoni]